MTDYPPMKLEKPGKALQFSGVIPGGAGGATAPPQLLANNTFWGFSHTTDRNCQKGTIRSGVNGLNLSDKNGYCSIKK